MGTKLVVLSACDSGRGAIRTGQGVYGLRRSFFSAGAETLVTSLWRVADGETSELMASTTSACPKEAAESGPSQTPWWPFANGIRIPITGLLSLASVETLRLRSRALRSRQWRLNCQAEPNPQAAATRFIR